jgi:hypothetical protein
MKNFGGKPGRKEPSRRPRYRWDDIKRNVTQIGWWVMALVSSLNMGTGGEVSVKAGIP